jgi:hypothetical protein
LAQGVYIRWTPGSLILTKTIYFIRLKCWQKIILKKTEKTKKGINRKRQEKRKKKDSVRKNRHKFKKYKKETKKQRNKKKNENEGKKIKNTKKKRKTTYSLYSFPKLYCLWEGKCFEKEKQYILE